MSGLILEGVCGSGKTSLLKMLVQSTLFLEKTFLSSIVLTEHQTQRVLERKEEEIGLAVSDNLSLLEGHVGYFESLHARLEQMPWRANGRSNMRIPYILERFHLTHACHYPHVSWKDVENIDTRLANLNCKLCILKTSPPELERRIIKNRDQAWREYLKRYGKTDKEILEHYSKQQKSLLALAQKTKLETIVIDTAKTCLEDTLAKTLAFWEILEKGSLPQQAEVPEMQDRIV